jgi:hypothetical protein
MTHRGLRHINPAGGEREAPLLCHRHKGSQLPQIGYPIHDEWPSLKARAQNSIAYAKKTQLAFHAL